MPRTLQWHKFVSRVGTVYCAQIQASLPSCCHHSITFNLLELQKHSHTFALVVLHNIVINSFAKKSAQLNFTKLIHMCLKSEYFKIRGGDLSIYEPIHGHSDMLRFFFSDKVTDRGQLQSVKALLFCLVFTGSSYLSRQKNSWSVNLSYC